MENWSPRWFYRTMLSLFKSDPNSRVEVPFHYNRPLSAKEYRSCAEHYINDRFKEYLNKILGGRKDKLPQSPDPKRWPDLGNLGIQTEKFWKYEKALGSLYFAETKDQQRAARGAVKHLSQEGPISVRKALSTSARATPQAKRNHSSTDRIELFRYRAERQFLWAFLRRETGWSQNRIQRNSIEKIEKIAAHLANSYGYLQLTPVEIAQGLRNSNQADADTAKKFGLATSTVRSLLSKRIPR